MTFAAEQHFLFVTRWLAAAYMLAGSVSNDGRAAEQPGFLRICGVGDPPPVTPADRPCEMSSAHLLDLQNFYCRQAAGVAALYRIFQKAVCCLFSFLASPSLQTRTRLMSCRWVFLQPWALLVWRRD